MLFSSPIRLTDALRFETLKKVLALTDAIGSRDIQEFIPAAIRERSFFSARTPYADILSSFQDKLSRLLQPDVRQTADGLVPTAPGGGISPGRPSRRRPCP